MLLTIDIGNTNITLGLFQGKELAYHWRLASEHERMPDEYGLQLLGLLAHHHIQPEDITGAIVCSVVPPLTTTIQQACVAYLKMPLMIMDLILNTGIEILIDEPSSVGMDRIVNSVAVDKLYGGPACVIDFGTATTFDIISEDGDYLGGAITAGIGISAQALSQRTSKLPRVDLKPPPSVIGKNTIHAMQSGILFGYTAMVEGMVERFRQELGSHMKVISTGGLAETIARETKVIQVISPWLTLEGLRFIWEMNNKQ